MTGPLSTHLRRNAVGYVAVFIALGGTAAALPGSGSVTADDIRRDAVRGKQIQAGAVRSEEVVDGSLTGDDVDESTLDTSETLQARVFDLCAPGAAIRAILDTGKVTCEPVGGGSPTGPAGGDLIGNYPDPEIGSNAVGGGNVANGSLSGTDVLDDSISPADLTDDVVDTGDLQRSGRVVANVAAGTTVDAQALVQSGPFTIRGRCQDGVELAQQRAQITVTSTESGSMVASTSGRRGSLTPNVPFAGFAPSTNEQDGVQPNVDMLVAIAPSGAVLSALVSATAKRQGVDCVFTAAALTG